MKQILITIILPCLLFADDRLRLKKADILESKVISGEKIQFLRGDVEFQKGDVWLNCQEGRYKEKKEVAWLFKQVKVKQKELTLTCDTLKYFSREDRMVSTGRTHVWDPDYDLISDSLIFFTEQDSGVAIGRVELVQNRQTITADRIEYVKRPGQDGVSYTAIGQVKIQDSTRVASCGKAIYNRTEEVTILQIQPEIREENRILSGEKIVLTYKEDELKNIHIPKQARASTISSGYENADADSTGQRPTLQFKDVMTSSILKGYFIDGKLDSIRLEGMAATLYHIFDDSVYQGKNETSGDTIIMQFANSELDRIFVDGGSRGVYSPDTLTKNSEYPIIYSANQIDYRIETEKSDLMGDAKVRHGNTNLEAGFIKVNWRTNLLYALPKAEADTLSPPIKPTITEKGREPMVGDDMMYNLDTKRGRVKKGATKADDGYYAGKEIRNESDEIFYIRNSSFTTCDLEIPHFHFESDKMKIVQDDVVIARPIILHLGQIPVMGIPLGIFPHRGGRRHSGWIMPAYGENRSRGQFIDGLGYYWAPNDIWGTKFTMSIGDRQGVVFKLNNQYRVRYKFNGSIYLRNQQFLTGSDDITTLGKDRKSNFMVRWAHAQVLRNHQSLNANVTYSSNGDYNRTYGLDVAERMNQKATSNMTYTKRWPKSKNSISMNLYSNQDLLIDQKVDPNSNYFISPTGAGTQLNIVNRTLPKFSFRHGQSNLIPTTATNKKWYHNITWNYGLNYTNKDRQYYESQWVDSTETYDWERDENGDPVDTVYKDNGWIHTASINAPQKIFKYISINPSLSLRSAWVNRTFEGLGYDSTQSFISEETQGFAARTTGSFSLSASTQIYGIFPIPIGPIKVIRHVASPSIGFSWSPDFSKPLFGQDLGYVQAYTDPFGNEFIHDRFSGTMAGSTPRSERKSMNFSLNNVFQAKVLKDDEEKKVDLLSWRMSSSYNFAADEYRLANLRSSLRSKVAGNLNLDFSVTHDFYGFDPETGARVPEFNKNKNGLITPRLTNARFSTGFRFSGTRWHDTEKKQDPTDDTTAVEDDLSGPGLTNPLNTMKNTLKGGKLWSTNVSLSYSYTVSNPLNPKETFWVNTTSSIQMTKNWRVSYRARFDIMEKDLVNHSLSLYRDLHCWELSLNWTPGGLGQGVYVKLNVKSPTLKDLKIEKRGGVYSRSPF